MVKESSSSTLHEYVPISAKIKFQGVKKPDTLVAKFPTHAKVREGYEVKYIQDVVDLDYLSAIYPMQLTCLDERGYDQDPSIDPDETRFVNVTTGRFKGYYALDFNATAQGVNITTHDRIDISKQFDIYIFFTPNKTQFIDGNNEPILWSFYDGSNGLEIGMAGNNGNNNSWRGFMRIGHGLVDAVTASNETIFNTTSGNDDPVLIRVCRGQDNVIRMYVNGVEDATFTTSANLQPSGVDMIFGNGRGNNDHYKGYIHQIRVYSGIDLTEQQHNIIRWAKPQPFTMKFAGRVWKLTGSQTSKTANCQSHSLKLVKAKLGEDNSSPTTTALTTSFKTLLQDAADEIFNTSFKVKVKDSFAYVQDKGAPFSTLSGNIINIGSFLDFATILMVFANTTFYTTPRGLIIVESDSGKSTDHVFDQNSTGIKYNIKDSEENDTTLANEVIITGSGGIKIRRFFNPNDLRRTFRKNYLQLDNLNDLDNLATKLRAVLGGTPVLSANPLPKSRHVVTISAPVTHVRFNQVVNVKRKNGQNASLGGSNEDLDENESVAQVELAYPSGTTIIQTGEVEIDFFNDVKIETEVRDGLIDTTL